MNTDNPDRPFLDPSGSMSEPLDGAKPAEDFFALTPHGGTDVSAALATAIATLEERSPPTPWNRFIFIVDAEPDPQFASGEGLPEGVLAELRSKFLCDAVSPDEALASLKGLLAGCACGRCEGEEKKTSD